MTPAITDSSDLLGLTSMLVALVAIRVVAWVWDRLAARFEPVRGS